MKLALIYIQSITSPMGHHNIFLIHKNEYKVTNDVKLIKLNIVRSEIPLTSICSNGTCCSVHSYSNLSDENVPQSQSLGPDELENRCELEGLPRQLVGHSP